MKAVKRGLMMSEIWRPTEAEMEELMWALALLRQKEETENNKERTNENETDSNS